MGEGETVGILSLFPPLLAIGLALATRQVFVSLALGIWAGYVILAGGNPLVGTLQTIDAVVAVFGSAGNSRIVIFTLLIGSLIALIQANGGVEGFVARILSGLERSSAKASARGQRRRVELLAALTGLVLFIESNISILSVGTLFRPLSDRLGVPREKLAYIADSTSAPSNVLIPLNAWGAFVAGLLLDQGVEGGFGIVLGSVAFNFYALAAILGVFAVILSGRDLGAMRAAEARGTLLREGAVPMIDESISGIEPEEGIPHRARNMLLPLMTLVALVPVGLVFTGSRSDTIVERLAQGETVTWFDKLQAGSGSSAILYATTAAILVALLLSKAQGLLGLRRGFDLIMRGMAGMLPLAILMVLAFAIGDVAEALGTGTYVVGVAEPWLSPALLPALVFVAGAFIAFATGTSWGTFAILVPIAIPLALAVGSPLPVIVAAIMGGGVFGDHASPISDTSVISSMAAGSDHIDHVRTQLPYALIAGGVAVVGYLVLGVVTA